MQSVQKHNQKTSVQRKQTKDTSVQSNAMVRGWEVGSWNAHKEKEPVLNTNWKSSKMKEELSRIQLSTMRKIPIEGQKKLRKPNWYQLLKDPMKRPSERPYQLKNQLKRPNNTLIQISLKWSRTPPQPKTSNKGKARKEKKLEVKRKTPNQEKEAPTLTKKLQK